jgi:hypothetical protein
MKSYLGYHGRVRRFIPASVAALALILFLLPLFPRLNAQVSNAFVPPIGAVGRTVTGTVPNATVPVRPPTGAVRPPTSAVPNVNSLGFVSSSSAGNHNGHHQHPHHHFVPYVPAMFYAVPLPYAIDIGPAEDGDNSAASDNDEDANYQGGPTVFDRRGSGADSYVPPVDDEAASDSAERADDNAPDPGPPDPTTLVFRDGHKLEVTNYAIVGPTLFDMTPGHSRKVALAELDLDATREQNEERGITFQLPTISQAN